MTRPIYPKPPIRFPVEAGHIRMFARAIGVPDPSNEQAASAGDAQIAAPPTFVQAVAQFDPDYTLRPRAGRPWLGSGRTPTGILVSEDDPPKSVSLHAEQHFVYHRTVQAGDVLTAEMRVGETWTKQGRSGVLVFTEFINEFRDETGTLVVTARGVGVRTQSLSSTEPIGGGVDL